MPSAETIETRQRARIEALQVALEAKTELAEYWRNGVAAVLREAADDYGDVSPDMALSAVRELVRRTRARAEPAHMCVLLLASVRDLEQRIADVSQQRDDARYLACALADRGAWTRLQKQTVDDFKRQLCKDGNWP